MPLSSKKHTFTGDRSPIYGDTRVRLPGNLPPDHRVDPREEILRRLNEDPGPKVGREGLLKLIRSTLNAPATLAGLGEGLVKGARFSAGPAGTIVGEYDDPSEIPSEDAHALGDTILRRSNLPEDRLPWTMTHELGHASQGRKLGPFLPAAAGATSAGLLASGSDPYSDSPFEKGAYSEGLDELMRSTTDSQSRALLRAIVTRGREKR